MTDRDLLLLDQAGFIPGPGESEADFLIRVEESKKKYMSGGWIPEAHWDWVREFLFELFNVKPLYICAFYSNRGLAPWQGAATWIEEGRFASVQLREGLRAGKVLGLYSREEILAHEAVHGVRCAFNEGSEEFFAYMSSEKKYRRVLGPIIRRPWEVWPFLGLALGGMFMPICYLAGSVWAGAGFFRLIKHHLRLRRAAKHIYQRTGDARRTRAILFRLTDKEIEQFSKNLVGTQNCLRWRVINAYLRGDV